MRPTDRSQAIAFLLSFGAIPLGCPAADDSDDTGATTNPSTTVGTTNPSTTAGTDSGGTDSAGTDSAGTDSDPSVSTTNGTASTTNSTTVSTTDPSDPTVSTDPDTGYGSSGYAYCEAASVPAVCTTYAAHYVKCFPKYASYEAEIANYCACSVTYYAPMYGAGCAAAFEDYYACLNGLACDNMDQESCAAESMALDDACGFGGDTGGSDG